jgi:predicted nucleotidyltransferase
VQLRALTTIAILGGNTVAGLALSFLLKGAGYAITILKAPLTGSAVTLLRDVDLLLVSPDLDDERRKESLAILRGAESRLRAPVLTFSPAVEERLFAEDAGSSWPVEISGLAREIEAALRREAEIGPAFVAELVDGDAAAP